MRNGTASIIATKNHGLVGLDRVAELPSPAVAVEVGWHKGLERFGRDAKPLQSPPFGDGERRDDIVAAQELHLVRCYRKNLRKKTE